MSLNERLNAPGPKRILALDGGGIRGILSVGILEHMEQLLRVRCNRPDLVLSDYFDLIGGTSTGAIIAALLALGKETSEIREMYLVLGGRVFGKKNLKKWEAFLSEGPLEEELEKAFGDRTLDHADVKTGLCVVTKRADTRSVWPLLNHPGGRFFELNRKIKIRDAVRSSAAAPVFFKPEKFDVGVGEVGAFVDGGVSMANNPALQLFYIATLKGFPFHWQVGEDNLMITSVGTGSWIEKKAPDDVVDDKLWDWAKEVPGMLMEDANWQNQMILQSISRTKTPWHIDLEVGDLRDDVVSREPLLTYLRYNVLLQKEELEKLDLGALAQKAKALRPMANAENRFDLLTVGKAAAKKTMSIDHFPKAFDV